MTSDTEQLTIDRKNEDKNSMTQDRRCSDKMMRTRTTFT